MTQNEQLDMIGCHLGRLKYFDNLMKRAFWGDAKINLALSAHVLKDENHWPHLSPATQQNVLRPIYMTKVCQIDAVLYSFLPSFSMDTQIFIL